MITDVSPVFLDECVEIFGTPNPNVVLPDYMLDKCMVVKCVYKDAEGNYSKIKTGNYFIGYQYKNGYYLFNDG